MSRIWKDQNMHVDELVRVLILDINGLTPDICSLGTFAEECGRIFNIHRGPLSACP